MYVANSIGGRIIYFAVRDILEVMANDIKIDVTTSAGISPNKHSALYRGNQ